MRFRGNHSKTHLRKESRTIPIYGSSERGDGLDANKWYRCWHCGFLCNVQRDALGDSQSRDGTVTKDYAGVSYGKPDNMGSPILVSCGHSHVLAQPDSNGDPKLEKHPLMVSESSYGCPFCHTLNWRGDY